jgi:hypothetical protein
MKRDDCSTSLAAPSRNGESGRHWPNWNEHVDPAPAPLVQTDARAGAVACALLVQEVACEVDMTTLTVTNADVGTTVARSGALSSVKFLIAGEQGVFCLIDDAYAIAHPSGLGAVPKQIFLSDCLGQSTNRNNILQAPYGILLSNVTIPFDNLTVKLARRAVRRSRSIAAAR